MRVWLALALAACGDDHAQKVCANARARLEQCNASSPSVTKFFESGRCESNEKIVRKYDVCLGTGECEWFLSCLETYKDER